MKAVTLDAGRNCTCSCIGMAATQCPLHVAVLYRCSSDAFCAHCSTATTQQQLKQRMDSAHQPTSNANLACTCRRAACTGGLCSARSPSVTDGRTTADATARARRAATLLYNSGTVKGVSCFTVTSPSYRTGSITRRDERLPNAPSHGQELITDHASGLTLACPAMSCEPQSID